MAIFGPEVRRCNTLNTTLFRVLVICWGLRKALLLFVACAVPLRGLQSVYDVYNTWENAHKEINVVIYTCVEMNWE